MKVQKPLFSAVIDSCESYARELKRPLPFYNIETKTRPFSDNIFHPEPKEFTDLMMKIIWKKAFRTELSFSLLIPEL
jgi:glycerophosphoryl diester phosphodiesterase